MILRLETVLEPPYLLSTACVTHAGDNVIRACTRKLRALLKVTQEMHQSSGRAQYLLRF